MPLGLVSAEAVSSALAHPGQQQLLGKAGLLHTAAAAGAEQRAAYAAATAQCDRAMPGRTGLSTRSAPPGTPTGQLHLPRPQHDLAFRDALFASGLPFVLSINDVPEAWELYSWAGSITRLTIHGASIVYGRARQQDLWRRW